MSSCSPASSKTRPEPAVKSLTVELTRTSRGSGQRRDAGADVDRDPADLAVDGLDLAGVDAGPDLDPEVPDAGSDGLGAMDGTGGSIERREEAVAGRIDLRAREPLKLASDDLVMGRDEVAPGGIADLGGPCGGTDDIGEQDGREPPGTPDLGAVEARR